MKIRLFAALLVALLSLSLMAGCTLGNAESQQLTQPPEGAITAKAAEEIAISHAQVNPTEVTRLRTEFDYENGVPEYDVEFYHDGWEYDYEIHAQTGEILFWDKEIDD